MKRAVAAVLGLAACAYSSLGQGHVTIWSYYAVPYNQITWWADGMPVNDTDIQLKIHYGAGSVSDAFLLTEVGPIFTVNPALTYNGGGYYDAQTLVTPTEGLYTFLICASDSSGTWGV